MSHTVYMPEVAANSTRATLVCWNKVEGERIHAGQSIADIETDKAVLELPVAVDGVVSKLLVAPGTEVAVGAPIAILVLPDDTRPESIEDQVHRSSPRSPDSATASPTATQSVAEFLSISTDANSVSPPSVAARIPSSPVARLLAKQNNIDLGELSGSGPQGRITKQDVIRSIETRSVITNPGEIELSIAVQPSPKVMQPSAMRQTIARRLTQSKSEIPHFYLRACCDVDELLRLRREINHDHEPPFSINDFVVRAVALALRQVPQMNVSWRDNGLYEFDRADICIAVDTPRGLLTPIVRDACNKSLSAISREIRELAQAARTGTLQPHQYQDGTFSITNLGMFGVDEFDAIINPPQAGILAVGAIKNVPVVRSDSISIGRAMHVVLSADHRAIDGAMAARWLAAFKHHMQQPLTMLV